MEKKGGEVSWAKRTIRNWQRAAADQELRREVETNRDLVNWCCHSKWSIFWTQTYRGNHSEDAARSRFLYFLADSKWQSAVSELLWVTEPHKNIPSHHVHALLSLKPAKCSADNKTPLQRWSQDWRYLKNQAWDMLGKALILPVSPGDGAVWYVLKYVTKRIHDVQSRELARAVSTPQKLWGIETCPLTRQERPRSLVQMNEDALSLIEKE